MEETEVRIETEHIALGQLLKLAGLAGTGGDAKAILAEGAVLVNGDTETRRGRKLRPGDLVEIGDRRIRVS
jgi:ribosome-associated protein